MKKMLRKIKLPLLALLLFVGAFYGGSYTVEAKEIDLQYRTLIEGQGWSDYSYGGAISGSMGKSLRLEALEMKVLNHPDLELRYSVHIQNIGWQDYKSNGVMAGTLNQNKRLEAVKIELAGKDASQYDVYYRVHVQNFGWLDWTKNGHAAGSEEYSYRMEALEVKIVDKGSNAPGSTKNPFENFYGNHRVDYATHIRNYGWEDPVMDAAISGRPNSDMRMEGLKINLSNELPSGSIVYSVHAKNIGWMDEVKDGALAGTEGESRRLEAVKIRLTGKIAESYGVTYKTYMAGKGWSSWSSDGAMSGTMGEARRIEAIQVKLYKKEADAKPEEPEVEPETPEEPDKPVDPVEPVDPEEPDEPVVKPEEPVEPNPIPEKELAYKMYKVTANLWLRDSPMGATKFVMSKGTEVKMFGETNGWANIEVNATQGYASLAYLDYLYDVYKEPLSMVMEINGVNKSYNKENIKGSGITLAYSGISSVKALVDGKEITVNRYDDKAAVAKYPNYDGSLTGYNFEVDYKTIPSGKHTLTVVATSNYGHNITKSVEFTLEKNPPVLRIDGISTGDPIPTSPKTITGIALNDSGVKAVNYYINGSLAGSAKIGLSSDGSSYPDYANSKTAGYSFILNPNTLNLGANTLKVELQGNDGSKEEQSVIILGSSSDHYKFENYPNSFKYYVDKEYINSTKYVGSGIEIYNKVKFNMEPANFIYDDVNKYLFMDLSYDVKDYSVSVDVLNKMLAGRGVLSGKGEVFLDAAIKFKVNPFYLIAHSLLETGNGTSALASGQKIDKVYAKLGDINSPSTPVPPEDVDKLVYNVYGIGAYNHDAVLWGSQYAYKAKWFSVDEAIAGGAEWIGKNYIHRSSGPQNTLYKMRFNIASNMSHQYATDIEWARKQASRIKIQFDAMGVDAPKTFYIPGFKP